MDVKKPNTGPPSEQLNLPAGFRFHPTDEELVVNYLVHKSESRPFPIPIVAEVNLYKFDPWELPDKALFGEREWYFFSPRDRKYPNGARPNRAAASGYWKATGTDKPINSRNKTVGVKKALVFYKGKAPKGIKTNWIMHEYRLAESKAPLLAARQKGGSLRLDDWVLCRIYKKSSGAFKVMMSTTPKSASGMKEEPEEDQLDEVLASLPDIDTNNSRFKMPNFAIGGGGGGGGGGSAAVRNSNINNSFFGSSPVFEEMFGSEPEEDTSENATSGSFEHQQQQQQQQQAMSFHPSPSFDTTATTTMNTNHYGYGGFQGADNATANTMVMINKVNPWAYETIYQQQLLQQQQQQQQQQQEFHSHRVISPPPMKLEKIPSNVSDILLQIQQQNAMCKKRSRREDEDDVQSTCRSPITRAMRQGFGFDLTHPMRYSS